MRTIFANRLPSSSQVKRFTIINLLKIYFTIGIQVILFLLLITAAFIAGCVSYSGSFIVPLLDKSILIGNVSFYASIIIGFIAIFRFISVPYAISLKKYYSMKTVKLSNTGLIIEVITVLSLIFTGTALVFFIICSFMDFVTPLLFVNKVSVILLLLLAIILVTTTIMWWNVSIAWVAKNFALLSLACGLVFMFISGELFFQYESEHDADFLIVQVNTEKEIEVNIIYKSADGVFVIEKPSGMPVFFPWQQVSLIKVSPSRMNKITQKKTDAWDFGPEKVYNRFIKKLVDFRDALFAPLPTRGQPR